MRIAQISPLYESVPPKLYGGTERVIAHLTDELVRRGHDVTLFASADSRTSARLEPCRDTALRLDKGLRWDVPAQLDMLARVRELADEFDLLHFHLEAFHLPLFADIAERTVTTLHGRLDIEDLGRLFARHRNYPMVSISESQRKPQPFQRWVGTVHHGYPRDQYSFTPKPRGKHLAFLGRVSPEKGLDHAIRIARGAGLPLKIAAKVDAADRGFYEREIEHELGRGGIDFIGEIGEAEKSAFLGDAVALLLPIRWPEPFGLVMIEAMACGTPVIAFACGSATEIIEDGRSGFLVQDVEEAITAVGEVSHLDRSEVRACFERRFTVETMTDGYERVYERLLEPQSLLQQQPLPERLMPCQEPAMVDLVGAPILAPMHAGAQNGRAKQS